MNCTECKHGHMKFTDIGRDVDDTFVQYRDTAYVKCDQGNSDLILKFYIDNGVKNRKDITDKVICFEPTEGNVRLDRLLNLMDELLKETKSKW